MARFPPQFKVFVSTIDHLYNTQSELVSGPDFLQAQLNEWSAQLPPHHQADVASVAMEGKNIIVVMRAVPDVHVSVLSRAKRFLWPEIKRGPADAEWVSVMREVAEVLGWKVCPGCRDNPPDGEETGDCCVRCFNIGLVDPGQ